MPQTLLVFKHGGNRRKLLVGMDPQGCSTHRYSVQAGNKEGRKAIRGWPRSWKGGDKTGRYSLGVEGIERWWKTRWAQGRLRMLGGDLEGSGVLGINLEGSGTRWCSVETRGTLGDSVT